MAAKEDKMYAFRKALLNLDVDFPDLSFVRRDSLSLGQAVRVHQSDYTPVFSDPSLPSADGVREQCFDTYAIDLGGKSATDNAGKRTWKLSQFICEVSRLNVIEPASFVATACSDSPVFLTSQTASTGNDLIVDVFSWDTSGNPAPKVQFAWRCWTEAPAYIE